ncbi:Protein Dopey-1 [Manis pentadactyla]|nr:Protein Dopey-1 [Manis pentadactyla]
MRVRKGNSRNYDSQNPSDQDSISQKASRKCNICSYIVLKVAQFVPVTNYKLTVHPRLFMLKEECPPQSQFFGKRRIVDITRAPKEERLLSNSYSLWKVLLIDQLSKRRNSEWVTSSEKYVELISTRSEEPTASKRL